MFIELCRAFNQEKIPYAVVGGYALALHGIIRATVDIDFVVSLDEKHLKTTEGLLKKEGLQSRIPIRAQDVAQFHEEYRKNRNLIAWSFVDFKDPTRQVDLLIFPYLNDLETEQISVHGVKVRVATLKSLLKMKRLANRPEDQLDIQKIQEALQNAQKN